MNASLKPEHLDQFVAHVVATLPDSLRARKTILVSLDNLLPRAYPGRANVALLVQSLHRHEQDQLKFNLPAAE